MAKKLTKAQLHELGFHNPFEFYNASGPINAQYPFDRPAPPVLEGVPQPTPYVSYRNATTGRGSQPWAWQVSRKGFDTDPDGHWTDNKRKTFTAYSDAKQCTKQEVLEVALEWVRAHYSVLEWVKDPLGSYGPKAFVEARNVQLASAYKEMVESQS